MSTQKNQPEDYIYLKFSGPLANDGQVNIGKVGKALVALDRWSKVYARDYLNSSEPFVLRANDIQKGSAEIQITLKLLGDIASSPVGVAGAVALFAQTPGVKDFLKGLGSTLGEQVALKLFSGGKVPKETEPYVKNGNVYVAIHNSVGRKKEIKKKDMDFYRSSQQTLNGLYALEQGKEEELRLGYHENSGYKETAVITIADKDSFVDYNDPDSLARRMSEPFEESKAEKVRIVGQFVDFHGMAHRYKFSFQVRREQDKYGKQKILCIVKNEDESEILDLLKPENRKNICISGMATQDQEKKMDKIKIDWFNEDLEYNPDQESLL